MDTYPGAGGGGGGGAEVLNPQFVEFDKNILESSVGGCVIEQESGKTGRHGLVPVLAAACQRY